MLAADDRLCGFLGQHTSRTTSIRSFSRAHLLIAGLVPSVGTLCEAAFSCVVILVLMPAYLGNTGPREPESATEGPI